MRRDRSRERGCDHIEPRKAEAMAENLSQGAQRANGWDAPSVGSVTEHAMIGASIVIKGEVSGKEHLFIDGTVEGAIHFSGTQGDRWP
jgi:hypothetical protein